MTAAQEWKTTQFEIFWKASDIWSLFIPLADLNITLKCWVKNLIIGCHGDNGKIIVPVLGEEVYYSDECRGNLGFEELHGKVTISNKTVICTGCTTGSGALYKAFTNHNNTFIAPSDYIEGKSDLLFVVNMFYHLSNSISLEDAYRLASKIDSETALYKIYFK